MPKYLFSASLTESGLKGVLKEGGTSREAALKKTAASVGGTLEAFYFAFGEDDVILIVDLPDASAAAALAMNTTASGAVFVRTTVLLTPKEMDQASKTKVSYRPPGT